MNDAARSGVKRLETTQLLPGPGHAVPLDDEHALARKMPPVARILAPPANHVPLASEPSPVVTPPTDDVRYDDVVAVGTNTEFGCTGVLVASSWVLTARHCLSARRVLFGMRIERAQTVVRVTEVRVPADPRVDAALFRLEQSVRVRPRPYRKATETGAPVGTVRLLGFGSNARTGLSGQGLKRAADIAVFGWGCDAARAAAFACDPVREMVIARRGDTDTCNGDSGGPVLELVGGSYRLIAITSRAVPSTVERCGDGGIYTRVDGIADWISSTTAPDGP
jgi:V8-like Glu-specific endopeptidase